MIGRLGNNMWQYAVCRTIAEDNNYEFHIPRCFSGSDLFNCSLGVELDLTNQKFFDFYMNNSFMAQFYNPNIFQISDFTKLVGFFQCERYIQENRENIRKWFSLKNPNIKLLRDLKLDKEICVINFRGGDYKEIPDVYLDINYWNNSISYIKKINSNIQFIVVTDDITAAKMFFPEFPVEHFTVADDFLIISQAKYLIIANSTFSWWAAWLNTSSKIVIAPKYWMRHNQSQGYWAPGESITRGFCYMDRSGKLYSSTECINEVNHHSFSYENFPY